jgi:hypothetical protein
MEDIESSPLPWGTTSQKAELIALTRALTLAKDKKKPTFTLTPNMPITIQSYGKKGASSPIRELPLPMGH